MIQPVPKEKFDRLQLIALAGLMFLGTAFVFSATMVNPVETDKSWFAVKIFPRRASLAGPQG